MPKTKGSALPTVIITMADAEAFTESLFISRIRGGLDTSKPASITWARDSEGRPLELELNHG